MVHYINMLTDTHHFISLMQKCTKKGEKLNNNKKEKQNVLMRANHNAIINPQQTNPSTARTNNKYKCFCLQLLAFYK